MSEFTLEILINEDTPDVVVALYHQVANCLYEEEFTTAMELCNDVKRNLEESSGDDYLKLSTLVDTILAEILFQMKLYETAIKILKYTSLLQVLEYGKKSIEYANTLNNQALCYIMHGKLKDAEANFKKVLNTAYEDESSDGSSNKSKWLQMLAPKKLFGIGRSSNEPVNNIWKIAEERERKKVTRQEEAPSVWFKPAAFDNSRILNVALKGLIVLYEDQGKTIAVETLKKFADQQSTEVQQATQSRIPTPPPLPPSPPSLPSNTILTPRRELLSHESVSRPRIPTPTPITPPSTSMRSFCGTVPKPLTSRPAPPPPPPKLAPRQSHYLEKIIADLQAEIADKARRLAEAERTIETHGAFCCICLTEVANRMWSECHHLAACNKCSDRLNDVEENRSYNGIACPKCRTHGYPLPAFI